MIHILSMILVLASAAWALDPVTPSANPASPQQGVSATEDTAKKDILGTIKNWTESAELKINLPVSKFTLPNGLTVILLEDHSVPMVSYHTWYRVGSRDEKPGVTGAAHMLEHMMFKGAQKYDGKAFDRIFHENGIVNNAFTTNDYTGFYENLPSSKLELVMDMEVDRMKALALNPDDLKSEKEVVKEERRWRVDNNPMGLVREVMMSTVFKTHPYKWPVIGVMKDIADYDVEKLRYFYRTFYVPNNAVLVLVGDFKISKAKALIEKYYGSLPSKPLPERKYASEPVQTTQRNAVIKKDVQNNSFIVAFQSPKSGHPDSFALDLAANILGAGTSSRLHKRLVYQKQIATGAYAYNFPMIDGGVFGVGVNMKPGLGTQEALDVVYNEIWKLRNQPLPAAELEKAKTLVMKELIDGLRTMDGKARSLAVNEIVTGSYESLLNDIEKYQSVTAEDIKRVMTSYTQQTQRSIITLQGKGAVAAAPPAAASTAAGAPSSDAAASAVTGAPAAGGAASTAAPSSTSGSAAPSSATSAPSSAAPGAASASPSQGGGSSSSTQGTAAKPTGSSTEGSSTKTPSTTPKSQE